MQRMPNEVAAKLKTLVAGASADGNFGLMPYKTWPSYPNSGSIQAIPTFTGKWDAKFVYYVNNQKAEREAFSIRFHYQQTDAANGDTPSYDGMPIVLPYDTSGLPENTLKQVEMRADKLATSMMAVLGMTAAEWRAEFSAGGWPHLINKMADLIEATTQSGSPISCKIELNVRRYESVNKTTGVKKAGEDGEDIIRERVGAN